MRLHTSIGAIGFALVLLATSGCDDKGQSQTSNDAAVNQPAPDLASTTDASLFPDLASPDFASSDFASVTDLATCPPSPLADYCQGSCLTYSQRLAQLQEGPCSSGTSPFPHDNLPSAGRCGALDYVLFSPHGIDGTIEYYDGGGHLVAAYYRSDTYEFCNRSTFEIWYGAPPDCVRMPGADGGVIACGHPDGGF